MLSFQLSRAARLLLIVHGPGPGCELAGQVPITGQKGLNLFPFDGTIRNRPLPPGTYILTAREKGTTKDLLRSYVTIVAPGFLVKTRLRPKCARETTPILTADAPPPLVFDVLGATTLLDAPEAANESKDATPSKTSPQSTGATLGEQSTESSGLPALPQVEAPSESGSSSWLLLLTAVLGALLGLAVLVAARRRSQRRQYW